MLERWEQAVGPSNAMVEAAGHLFVLLNSCVLERSRWRVRRPASFLPLHFSSFLCSLVFVFCAVHADIDCARRCMMRRGRT
jgi:hypothetical protein